VGKKRPVRKVDNLPPSCAAVTKSGNLNFLELSGPVQACNGTALTFISYCIWINPSLPHRAVLKRQIIRQLVKRLAEFVENEI